MNVIGFFIIFILFCQSKRVFYSLYAVFLTTYCDCDRPYKDLLSSHSNALYENTDSTNNDSDYWLLRQ